MSKRVGRQEAGEVCGTRGPGSAGPECRRGRLRGARGAVRREGHGRSPREPAQHAQHCACPLRHLDLGAALISVQVWIGVQALALLCAPCGALEKLAADVVESGFVGFMPEAQVTSCFVNEFERYKEQYIKRNRVIPQGRLQIFPRVFAEGTITKPYSSITVDCTDLPEDSELLKPDPSYCPSRMDLARAKSDYMYLIQREHQPGPVHVSFRGKSIAFTVGCNILALHFGLEASLRIIPLADFNEIMSTCVPGPNPDRKKAKRLRSFPLPPHFIVPGSSQTERRINIFAAIIMEEHVIIFADFSRLMRMHVLTGPRIFQGDEIEPGSPLWSGRLWSQFPSGPDWVCELPAAIQYLHDWRASVLRKGTSTPMIDVLTEMEGPGAGIGQHLANDLLFLLAIHPDTPAIELCADNTIYDRLLNFLPGFMAHWFSREFIKSCGGRVNSTNPFAFNDTSDSNFRAHQVHVYRKENARLEAELFALYQSQGFLDPDHTIAQLPSHWRQNNGDEDIADIAAAQYSTTVGVARFREVLNNKVDPEYALQTCLRPGRPTIIRTGMMGRPRKSLTRKALEKNVKKPCKRKENKENIHLLEAPRRSTRSSTTL
ncbi:hypothetical protein C8J57DRAFT_1532615 [Mycena rebaudengoi]|nr:hypothetical protein C8J57DRAFT_1532615 [Mycena rebaudengoi]